MLNRRILRIKAMQSLYGYFLSKESAFKSAEHDLVEKYSVDHEIHDFGAKAAIKDREKQIRIQFINELQGKNLKVDSLSSEIINEIREEISNVKVDILSEGNRRKKAMITEAENLESTYLKMLSLLLEFSFLDEQQEGKSSNRELENGKESKFNLAKNPLIKKLGELPELKTQLEDGPLSWKSEYKLVNKWYKEVLLKDETIQKYQSLETPSDEDHFTIVKGIYKHLIFKSEAIDLDLCERDLYWPENKSIIKSIVLRTLKGFDKEDPKGFQLKTITPNKEDDFEFFKVLFDELLKRDDELESLIETNAKNWDMDRIAIIDMILLKLALTEMIMFPSIPIKVTINEYIEISKSYSTPKSKQFVNGILDVMANKLSSEGVIKKSGRGLIDNK